MKIFFPRIALCGSLWFCIPASVIAQSYTFTTIAGLAGVIGTADGANTNALFHRPGGLAVDGAGNIYVADLLNHAIRKLAPAGTNWMVSTLAGLAGVPGSADGTNDQARFDHPSAVAVDNVGHLFVTDSFNHTLRKLTAVGTNWVVSTVAGLAGVAGSDDGANIQARFEVPEAIAVGSSGELYVTDRNNCTVREVRPVGTNWVVSTLAGVAITLYGGFVDGLNGDAEFNYPYGISQHNGGDLYVADFGNNAIRRIAPLGPDWVTTTVAGFPPGATGTNDGPGSQAMFNSPNGMVADAAGTLYVTDQFSYTIRKIEPVGNAWVVSTVAGLAGSRGSADGVGASARFYWPFGIVLDQAGNLFVADSYNHTIRKGTSTPIPSPALQFLLAAGQIVLSWPMTASNYVLETTLTLGSGASWGALTNGVVVSGGSYVLTNEVGAGSAFFRLHRQ